MICNRPFDSHFLRVYSFIDFLNGLFFVILDKSNVFGQIVDVFLIEFVSLRFLESLAFLPSLFVSIVVKHEIQQGFSIRSCLVRVPPNDLLGILVDKLALVFVALVGILALSRRLASDNIHPKGSALFGFLFWKPRELLWNYSWIYCRSSRRRGSGGKGGCRPANDALQGGNRCCHDNLLYCLPLFLLSVDECFSFY